MSAVFSPEFSQDEAMVLAVERVGTLLATYGQAYVLDTGERQPVADRSKADVLRGRLQIARRMPACFAKEARLHQNYDATYYLSEHPTVPGRVLELERTFDLPPSAEALAERFGDDVDLAMIDYMALTLTGEYADAQQAFAGLLADEPAAAGFAIRYSIDEAGAVTYEHARTGRAVTEVPDSATLTHKLLLDLQP